MASLQTDGMQQELDELEEAIAWMVALGVAVDPERLAAYRKIAQKWEDFVGGRGRLGVRELTPIVATYSYDLSALIAIHHTFGAMPHAASSSLAAQLGAATCGPIRIADARSRVPDPARVALFKAWTAAYVQQLASSGTVALDAISGIGFAHGRHYFTVAAERLDAQDSIEAGLMRASAQLVPALNGRQGARQRGLITLDASTLLNAGAPFLQAGSQSAADAAADQLLAHTIDARMGSIQACLHGMDRRIIGLMVLFSTVAVNDGDQALLHVERWALVWRDHISFSDFDLLNRMRAALRGDT